MVLCAECRHGSPGARESSCSARILETRVALCGFSNDRRLKECLASTGCIVSSRSWCTAAATGPKKCLSTIVRGLQAFLSMEYGIDWAGEFSTFSQWRGFSGADFEGYSSKYTRQKNSGRLSV